MSETPQERVSRWLNDPLVDLADTEIREAIRALLAENAGSRRAQSDCVKLGQFIGSTLDGMGERDSAADQMARMRLRAEKAEAERDALRAEVERLREELALECELVNLQAGDAFRAERERIALQTEVEGLWVIRDDAKSSQERMRLELVRLDTLARERGEEVERLQDLASDAGTRCGIESLKGKP